MPDTALFLQASLGCLLGGAAGDALGAPVEFLTQSQIQAAFGPPGITTYPGGRGLITDDTQMTIATARALVAAQAAIRARDLQAVGAELHRQYLAWLTTQDDPAQRRGPGNTCLTALRTGKPGSLALPINNSKGCGGVMRVAPVGLALRGQALAAYELGLISAAITHGHPGGYYPAGYLAALVAELAAGHDLARSAQELAERLVLDDDSRSLLQSAIVLASRGAGPHEAFTVLGQGWTGDEALAIGLFAALSHPADVGQALIVAVNHDGDSDSTGCICGAILGAALGATAIPAHLLDGLERGNELRSLATQLASIWP